ncbi:serine hydrolase [Pseudoroseomonas cervicalis]|uniref:serine hydrolase domain-containing protein n=1 Tax=Teichococcus cervicalis TaxID=204525 RepID=UPI0027867BF0|nr:serine hydrolase [Pseudoroseomonas cervicalis]MDQ1081846.1 CubicO group peptidase (beta-lactamase class C family) [Pseudoroseomonas cervicalis]
MRRRAWLRSAGLLAASPWLLRPAGAAAQEAAEDMPALAAVLEEAAQLPALRSVSISAHGRLLAARGYHGQSLEAAANIKSASKSVMSALVGIAIGRGLLEGVEQPIAPLLADRLPRQPDPRLRRITIGHLLSMQAGLRSTSGPRYGAWVARSDWVRAALAEPFEAEPGGPMVYSTGSTHLLSAILARRSGRPTLALARDWLGRLPDFAITDWMRDPQGIHLGGNEMAMRPRALLAFGELHRTGGLAPDGARLLPEGWVEQAWTPRTASRFTGDGYGYGWFLRRIGGEAVRYGWGFGGQMIYVVPGRGLSVAMTSAADASAARSGHRDALHALLERLMLAAAADGVPRG